MATYKQEFKSIAQFYDYICRQPLNHAFRWVQLASSEQSDRRTEFTGTKSFEEAVELTRNGWPEMASRLQGELKAANIKAPVKQVRKQVIGVAGYQPIVPLYLAGVPTNMISSQIVRIKQKVVTVTKLIAYSAGVSADDIIAESVKAMQIVQQLEAQSYRVNLNIAMGARSDGRTIIAKVKIKDAGEKLNISKLAFPMVNPSMLRRLMFRYIEIEPNVTKAFRYGYGSPVGYSDMQKEFDKDIVLPAIWDGKASEIKDPDMLKESCKNCQDWWT